MVELFMAPLNTMFMHFANAAFINKTFTCANIAPMEKPMHPSASRLLSAARKLGKGIERLADLAKALNQSEQTINNWAYRGNGVSKQGRLLAQERLGINATWIGDGTGPEMASGPSVATDIRHPSLLQYPVSLKNFRMVFVIGQAQGGLPERIWTDGDYPVGAADEYAEIATTDSHAFIVPVVGDSMSPKYEPGEFALVEPSTMPDVGEDVLVRLTDGRTMLKRLYRRVGDLIVLKSLNPFKPEEFSFPPVEVSWMYYVAHPVPARKIKMRM
ncbi:TPA: helix-turn-helix transcriptional regulator [Burkholderia vietnamiensis]|uniref:S24 family peptidase n=1 Tax=Burkholderia vietnamiensis TaxID=60552 RepID=UPI0015894DE6|nr:helix-turn-helix transcriptional regulator [Burkholderia vietnamiensis]HDR9159697.1 helix-turn-helix transcriptional regulator [Burkholderia vietnamiensis]